MFLIVCEYKTYKNTLEMSSCTSINSGVFILKEKQQRKMPNNKIIYFLDFPGDLQVNFIIHSI
jgi:hypothetical protein